MTIDKKAVGRLLRGVSARLPRSIADRLHGRFGKSKSDRPTTAQVVAELFPSLTLSIVDVGARWGSEGAWYRVPPLGRVIGFEPDPEECARLNASARAGERYLGMALSDHDGTERLTITRDPACSSLLPPIQETALRYPDLNVAMPDRSIEVEVRRLDGVAREVGLEAVHVLKLDTQGTELAILAGAGALLDGVLCAEVEVEFNPIYEGQALFGDVDAMLRAHKIGVWRLRRIQHYAERQGLGLHGEDVQSFNHGRSHFAVGPGRIFWGEATFIRDPATVADDDTDSLLRLAAIFDGLGETDGLLHCLKRLVGSPRLDAAPRSRLERHQTLCETSMQSP